MNLIEKTTEGYRIPGFIDAHVHVESSHLCPAEFGRLLVQHGTMTAVCDPHEIVNVAGEEGLAFMLENAKLSPADLLFELPSCVPATPFETSGATLNAQDTARLLDRYPELLGLGELMNVPGVLNSDPDVIGKIQAAKSRGKIIDGHFPGGSGASLRRYAAAGITSDHESTTAEEAREKLAAGMWIFIREGSAAKNLEALLPAVTDDTWQHCCFCADDLSAADLLAHGDIQNCLRKAVRLGLSPERAIAMATVNPARYFNIELKDDTYLIVKDLVDFDVIRAVKDGSVIYDAVNGIAPQNASATGSSGVIPPLVFIPQLEQLSFPQPPDGAQGLHAIGVMPFELLTDCQTLPLTAMPGLARLALLERHDKNHNIAYGFASGTGLKEGAIATTIAHDSHNLLVLGSNDADMKLAARTVARNGGACVVLNGSVIAEFPMQAGGLMSTADAHTVASQDAALRIAAKQTGCTLPAPVTALSFLALPVIPRLKITDKGLFDTSISDFIPLYW